MCSSSPACSAKAIHCNGSMPHGILKHAIGLGVRAYDSCTDRTSTSTKFTISVAGKQVKYQWSFKSASRQSRQAGQIYQAQNAATA